MSRSNRGSRGRAKTATSVSVCDIRLQKDIDDLDPSVTVSFPDPNNLKQFVVRIVPDTGLWKGGVFDFMVKVSENWPIDPPDVTTVTRIWHPNLAENGEVCLSLLKDHYSPTMSISHIIAGLQYLFCEPNPQSPLNNEAAMQMFSNKLLFENTIRDYISKYCEKI